MKTMTREEATLAMLEGKQVTSDEFKNPDDTYCIYDKTIKCESPFRYVTQTNNTPMKNVWSIENWRLRKYIPEDKDLVWTWDDQSKASASLRYYDALNKCTFYSNGERNGYVFNNYAPFNGTPPPNICKKEDLED